MLEPATRQGALPMALHPVMTFTGRPDDLDRLAGICFGVTAPEPVLPAAEALVIEMGGEPVVIDEANRALYHAGLASAANHLVALVASPPTCSARPGWPSRPGCSRPLLFAALDNALRLGDAGLTGPVARGDADTVAGHIAALRDTSPEALRAYLALARLTADRALAAGILSAPDAQRLLGRAVRGPAMMPVVARTRLGLDAARRPLGCPAVLVPTMGALHHGHRVLLRRARELAGPDGSVLVSIFVNPLQFGEAADLDRYPRTMDDDVRICADEGADLIFAPDAAVMYPRPQRITVDPGELGQLLEGESRPGHFAGVLTVVLKLFQLTAPDVAVFGEKDAQQLALVRRMAADLDLGIEIAGVPTVRDDDGLAISSRNRFLSGPERRTALLLPAALRAGPGGGARRPGRRAQGGRGRAQPAGGPAAAAGLPGPGQRAGPPAVPEDFTGDTRLLAAARVGATRLIDNTLLRLGAAD